MCITLCVQIASGFWRVHKRYSSSGQNDPNLWSNFSQGDTLLDYVFVLLKDKEIVLELMNPEVGPAGVEGDVPGLTTVGAATSRAKRRRPVEAGIQSLIDSSASIAASAAKQARLAELVALSTTLKNAQDAGLPSGIVLALTTRLESALQSSVGQEPLETAAEPEPVAAVGGGGRGQDDTAGPVAGSSFDPSVDEEEA